MGQPLYRISVVAERVGLSENLLRAWERRYGILEPQRSESGYRAYTEDDISLLRRVKQLIASGISIADVVPLLPSLRKEVKAERPQSVPVPLVSSPESVERWKQQFSRRQLSLIKARWAGYSMRPWPPCRP